jgi:hypothetical protein
MLEVHEIQQVVEHLHGVFENLLTRGVRSAGTAERNALTTLGAELMRVGAPHLAGRVRALNAALESNSADAPSHLLKAQASLRLFERVMTLEVARECLSHWKEKQAEEAADEPESE